MNIYVGNIPFTTTENDLEELFAQHGDVASVNIIKDRETGRSKGFGFVEMSKEADGEAAVKELDGHQLSGRSLKVNKARPKEDRPRNNRRPRY